MQENSIPQDPARTRTLEHRLQRETQGSVLFDPASRGRYASDASIYQIMPLGVFIPRVESDVSSAIDIARELKLPVLARGAGSSQCGQTVGDALVIDGSRHLRQITDIDVAARTAVVQPGVVLDELNARLKPHGLWFPVDVSTSAQATLGGMAGNNSCGSRSIAYGNMVHNVLGLSAWLSDGSTVEFGPVAGLSGRAAQIATFVQQLALEHRDQILERWPKLLRRVGGYNLDIFQNQSERPYTRDGQVNLAHLLVGSEGTLAYTRSLTLQLSELPRASVLGVVNFPSFRAAMQAPQYLVSLGPSAIELIDRIMLELSVANPAFQPLIEPVLIGKPAAVLLVEFSGEDASALQRKLDELSALMADLGLPGSVTALTDRESQRRVWEVRKAGLNIMMSLKGDGKPVSFIEDCAVPLPHLADYTDALTEVFTRHGTHGTWYAHASVGTLHVRPILDMRIDGEAGGALRMRRIAEEAAELVRRFKGAYSGEHGDGVCRGEWIRWQFGPALYEALRAIKQQLDPIGLFNPGRIIDPPRMDDASLFRFQPPSGPQPYRTQALNAALDWSAWNVQNNPLTEEITAPGSGGDNTGGFAKAVEMCNNNGHCRKFDAGAMCPSYRVTRNEQHVTRGRANTLRLALSGQLGAAGLSSQWVYDAMDLCVSCKACRRECPTGVDMAKMKIEFLSHYKAEHGFTLKDRLIAGLPDYAHALSRVAWLPNLRESIPGARWIGERVLGLSARRALPRWRRDTLWRDAGVIPSVTREMALQRAAAGDKVVVLFVDTFSGTFETENAICAARVLTRAGYSIHVPQKAQGHFCCGRTYLSCGMVSKAKHRLSELIAAVEPLARAGIAMVGLEPSCLLTLRDEALSMGLGEPARVVAAQAMLFEEFMTGEIRRGRITLALKPAPAPILVHGHCHQKAFGVLEPTLEILRLIPNAQPKLIETSCCGMAGSFGYEASHHQVSMQMAEAALLPAVRAAPGAIVVADGTSCRHQILQGSATRALHVAQLIDQLSDA
jgi:FAD/FMN-containing dehydrogenase/Fe-S oxidoreductase